jgi:precorrin-3B C17-methyltransferase
LRERDRGPGRLSVIGLGPGSSGLLAPLAQERLTRARAVVGYDRYMALVDPALLAGKTLFSSPMKKEMERTVKAVEFVLAGLDTVVVSSGDSGIYGMAGLVLEYLEREKLLEAIDPEIVPGIPALCAAAALLGAPLMHDFASISLSDLLTPLPTIMKRVRCAVEGDFVVVLYNPKSRKRDSYLRQALAMAAAQRGPDTPVGFVRNAYRPDQEVRVATLGSCDPEWADMLTIVVVGNTATRLVGNTIITPRGYFEKYGQ